MCGLVGYIGNQSAELATAKRLLIESQSRGIHATGYVEIDGTGTYTLRKQACSAREFVGNMTFEFKGPHHSFLGHTRHATTGDSSMTLQAHPFVGTRFIVFHNGTIQDVDQKRLSERFSIDSPNGVDSELFLSFLEARGSVDALRTEFLPFLTHNSVYALVIFDKVTKSIHFMRCNGRPLVYQQSPTGGLFYASTAGILHKALGKKRYSTQLLQPYTHLEIASNSGEILRKCDIEGAKAALSYSDARSYIEKYRKPIRFF